MLCFELVAGSTVSPVTFDDLRLSQLAPEGHFCVKIAKMVPVIRSYFYLSRPYIK